MIMEVDINYEVFLFEMGGIVIVDLIDEGVLSKVVFFIIFDEFVYGF